MTCPAQERLAAAASGEDSTALAHARECVSCRRILRDQQVLIDAARALPRPRLRPERRAALAAEVMAHSDLEHVPPWRGERVIAIVAAAVAAAAVLAIVLANPGPQGVAPQAPLVAVVEEPAIHVTLRAQLESVAPAVRASLIATGADYARAVRDHQDVVTLRDGELSVDATASEPVTIVAGDTRVTLASSRAKVIARGGVIVTTHVFAGTAQLTSGGRVQVIDAGDVWMRPADATVSGQPPAAIASERTADSLAEFRHGWEELRAHHHAQAIAAFDRATDPVVAEDAAFWAAIATEREGDLPGAATRLRAFLDKFSSSPRAEAARAALLRVAP